MSCLSFLKRNRIKQSIHKRQQEQPKQKIPILKNYINISNIQSNNMPSILILGKGFIGTYLVEECTSNGIQHYATTRDGREGSITFSFDSADPDLFIKFKNLPTCTHLVLTFPIQGKESMKLFCDTYLQTRPFPDPYCHHYSSESTQPTWILLGSTGAWKESADRHTPVSEPIPLRTQAEQELLSHYDGIVLHLAGLWGGQRHPKNWLARVAKTKLDLSQKGSLHLVHGRDVANGILSVVHRTSIVKHPLFTNEDNTNDSNKQETNIDFNQNNDLNFDEEKKMRGERWILSDLRVYDWWELSISLSSSSSENDPYPEWVLDLMNENHVHHLPRPKSDLGRLVDSLEFWTTFKLMPRESLRI